jgi:hypothetical protein
VHSAATRRPVDHRAKSRRVTSALLTQKCIPMS